MKHALVLLAFTLFSSNMFAQISMNEPSTGWITKGQVKFGGITKARLEYKPSGRDTSYFLLIKDVREQPKDNFFSIRFQQNNRTLETLYEVLMSFFIPENKKNRSYTKMFTLGNTNVHVQHKRLLGAAGIMFTTNDGYAYFTEKDIDKLFGNR